MWRSKEVAKQCNLCKDDGLLTAICMLAANSLADYSAAAVLQAASTADVRKGLLHAVRAQLRRAKSSEGPLVKRRLSQLPSQAIAVRCSGSLHHCIERHARIVIVASCACRGRA